MCASVVIFRPGKAPVWCSTGGELRRALGIWPLLTHPGGYHPPRDDRFCLCHVDIQATAEQARMTCEAPEYNTASDHFDAWALREAPANARTH